MWDWGYVHTIPNIYLVCYTATAVFSVVTGGALCDDTKKGCVADYYLLHRQETPTGWGFWSIYVRKWNRGNVWKATRKRKS